MKKRRKKKLPAVAVVGILLVTGCINLRDFMQDDTQGRANQALTTTTANGEMDVTFFDVGQGDCTLIQTEEETMLIDAGNNHKGELVVQYLEDAGVKKLDYLVLTHPDADHIGGADNVIENVEVERVLMPKVTNDTMTYEEVIEDIELYGIEVIHPETEKVYTLGDAEFMILCPDVSVEKENDLNNASVGIKLIHGENSFVLCGDAEEESEHEMVREFGSELECDVLKCGHHGSATASSQEFLEATDPTWAVISCGEDNSYGHPHAEVLERLENDDVQTYRTDRLGTIRAVSDGENIHWSSETK